MLEYSVVIEKVMNIGLDRINNNPEMKITELFKEATGGELRTVHIIVYDDPDNGSRPKAVFKDDGKILWHQGLAHRDGKIAKVSSPNYTVTYKITLSAWFRLISQQNTFRDLYWSDMFDAEGQYFFRDIVVWNRFWEQYKDVVKLSRLEKLMLVQKEEFAY